jgi:MFS family permease
MAPYSADYLGRKPTVFIGASIIVIAGLIQCLAVNISMFIAARFLSKDLVRCRTAEGPFLIRLQLVSVLVSQVLARHC